MLFFRIEYRMFPDQTILLGSFSKTIVTGFRLGWVAGTKENF